MMQSRRSSHWRAWQILILASLIPLPDENHGVVGQPRTPSNRESEALHAGVSAGSRACFVATRGYLLESTPHTFALEMTTPPATISAPPTKTASEGVCLKINQEMS
jgi:hypothetical protein